MKVANANAVPTDVVVTDLGITVPKKAFADRRVPRVAAFAAVVAACWDIAVNQAFAIRMLEARVCAAILKWLGVTEVHTAFRDRVVLVPRPGVLFSGVVTMSCSVLFPVLVMAVLTLAIIPGPFLSRLQRFVLSSIILIAVNFVRLCIVLLAGAKGGINTMAPVHEWVGTLVTVLGWILMLGVMLSLARRQRSKIHRLA
jgi:exosortase/archaeosortase family protein